MMSCNINHDDLDGYCVGQRQQQQKQKQKNVSFDETKICIIHSVPSLKDILSKSEQRDLIWFSTSDLSNIRSREEKLRMNGKRSKNNNNNESSSKADLYNNLRNEIGLETSKEKQKRKSRVQQSKYTVLVEQKRQWDSKLNDPESLARVGSDISLKSSNEAIQKAMNLAKQVQKQQQEHDNKEQEGTTGDDDDDDSNNFPSSRVRKSTSSFVSSTTRRNSNQKWKVSSSGCNDVRLSLPKRRLSSDELIYNIDDQLSMLAVQGLVSSSLDITGGGDNTRGIEK